MELKIINRAIAISIILTNIYFIPLSYTVIKDTGGSMGYGLLILPILLSTNFLLITAVLAFKEKFKNGICLLIVNGLGLLWNLFWLWLLVAIPTLTFFTSCNDDEKIEGVKQNEILVVTLEVLDNLEIDEITLISTGGIDKIKGNQVENKKRIKLKTLQRGEGTFKICVYTKTDTLCSQDSYIEGGYRPKLRLKDGKFKILQWF